jgi:nitrous oxidase accessory protein
MVKLGIGCLLLLVLPVTSFAREYRVGPGNLPKVLRHLEVHDVLILKKGVHAGPVTLKKSCVLEGEPGAILEGNDHGFTLVITANNVDVSRLTVRGSGSDLSTDDATVLLDKVQGVTVQNCRVESKAFGIYLKAGGGHFILNNEVYGEPALPRSQRGNGIHLWHTEKNTVCGNYLQDTRDGVYLSFTHQNLIEGNHASQLRYGIHYMYSDKNHLKGNRFDHCQGGIVLMFSRNNLIEENEMVANQKFGLLCLQLENSIFQKNHTAFNARGMFIEASEGNRFVGNRIEDNGVGLFLTAGSDGNTFNGNNMARNVVQIYQLRMGKNRWSDHRKGNYWSDYTGLDWKGDGIGDSPYQIQTAASVLLARRPVTRWFWMSPALTLLNWWESRIQGPRETDMDYFPLIRPFPEGKS